VRRKIPVQPADDPRNNPPWVQIYGPAWEPPQRAGPNSWSDYSPDRFTCSVIGTVSRDRKHLAAIATGSADTMCQAWHDCMHINSRWEPVGAPPSKQTWRLKIYLMLNDPALLLRKVAADFPEIRGQPAFAATPDGG